MGKYFGTDGIRGKAGEFLTPELALKAGWAISEVLKRTRGNGKLPFTTKLRRPIDGPAIVVAQDTRLSSPMLAEALKSGILSAQVNVIDIGVMPTSVLALAINYLDAIGGVMITASHNPIEDNGIKVFKRNGLKTNEKTENEIEQLIDNGSFSYRGPSFGSIVSVDVKPIYISHIKRILRVKENERIKVALDLAYGATVNVAKEAFSALGFSPVILHGEADGAKVNVNCGATNTRKLSAFMKQKGITLGFAFDGDGDRVIAVNDEFSEVDGDKIMVVLGLQDKTYRKEKKIVFTEMTNKGVEEYLQGRGFTCYRTPVGDIFVLEEMLKRGAKLGGEQSGHIICWLRHCTGDGVFVSLLTTLLLASSSYKLSKLTRDIPYYPQYLYNVPVKDRFSWRNNRKFLTELNALKKRFGKEVRFFIRPSGTENYVRVLTESKEKELAHSANQAVSKLFKSYMS